MSFTFRRALTVLGSTALLSTGVAATSSGSAIAEPPNIPDPATAASMLSQLTVRPDGSQDGYDRDKFPHWSNQGNSCNTREVVLRRDGTNVQVGDDCYPISGSWYSPFDGATWTDPSDVDIDHMVPLAEAWRTGASHWTQAERKAFANDLNSPQLIAVTDDVNQSKGDKGPEDWKPPSQGYWCTYARMWIGVKYKYDLTTSSNEKAALNDMLDRC
ncbi:HNH endonuclease family protein [Thermocrispum sp.]|uniref:HNH endonuclease family protein n=1 Tax=Thermocrispum sp. TaxID=2060768 RepID=UPI00257A963E|nr:HNH endonuclease family protein [Thermocrispum sp.]